MKYKAFAKPAVAIVAILVAAACATNADDVPGDQQATPAPTSTGATLPPADPPPDTKPPEKKCASTCAADTDCASTCADPGTGAVNCCDLATKQCYKAAAAVCPAPTTDPDGGTPAY